MSLFLLRPLFKFTVHCFSCILKVFSCSLPFQNFTDNTYEVSTTSWWISKVSRELLSDPYTSVGFPGGSVVKNPSAMQEIWVQSLGREDPLEEGMATHSSILAWKIPWTEEPSRLQSMGSQRVGRGWVTKHALTLHICLPWRLVTKDRSSAASLEAEHRPAEKVQDAGALPPGQFRDRAGLFHG